VRAWRKKEAVRLNDTAASAWIQFKTNHHSSSSSSSLSVSVSVSVLLSLLLLCASFSAVYAIRLSFLRAIVVHRPSLAVAFGFVAVVVAVEVAVDGNAVQVMQAHNVDLRSCCFLWL